jgi:hypothetical protein
MGMGQMLSVLGALMLLSMVSLGINSMIISKTTTMLEAEASLSAVSLAQTMIDEIQTKSYDASTVGSRIYDASDFTTASGLGPNGLTETPYVPKPDTYNPFRSVKYYNDVDDYHLYRRRASTPILGYFDILDSIYYVKESDPSTKSTTQTFFKKIVVKVTHRNMSYPVYLSDVVVYRRYF